MFRERDYEKNDEGEFLIPLKRGDITQSVWDYLRNNSRARIKLVIRAKPESGYPLCDYCRHCFAWFNYKIGYWECEMCGSRNVRFTHIGTVQAVIARYVLQ